MKKSQPTDKGTYVVREPKDLENIVREGNEYALYNSLKHIEFDYSQLFQYLLDHIYIESAHKPFSEMICQMMDVSDSTLYRWKTRKDLVKEKDAERLSALIALNVYGEEVFESQEDYREWLKASNIHLEGKAPIEILDSLSGMNYIKHLLDKIEYGAPI